VLDKLNYTLEPQRWIERYADYLHSYAFSRLNKAEVAEDLVQDTFFSALKAQESYQQNASEKTGLVSILKNKIIDHYRKKSTQNELNIFDKPVGEDDGFNSMYFEGSSSGDSGHWTEAAEPIKWRQSLETSVEKEEFHSILKGCISKLPQKWSAAFTMRNMDDLDTEEICKELSISPSNYWVIMHRAKVVMRECMEKNWFNQ